MKHENTSFTFVYLYLEIFVVFFWFAVLLHSRASSLTRTAAAAAVAYSRLLYITLFALFQPLSPVCVCMLFTCIFFSHFFILRSSTSCACAVTHEHQRMLDIRAVARVLRSMCTIYIYIPYVTHQVSLVHKSSGEWFFFSFTSAACFFFHFLLPVTRAKKAKQKKSVLFLCFVTYIIKCACCMASKSNI